MARQIAQVQTLSIRKACDIFGISEHCYRYQSRLADGDALIRKELLWLTQLHKSWGFGLCYLYLRNCAGYSNHKRVYRIYRELELNLRIKLNRRLHRDTPETLRVPLVPSCYLGLNRRALGLTTFNLVSLSRTPTLSATTALCGMTGLDKSFLVH